MIIPLTNGKYTFVDDRDYGYLMGWKWQALEACNGRKKFYVKRNETQCGKYKGIYMHRVITDAPKGIYVDHINGNALDNRRANLRLCTNSENVHNCGMRPDNTSGCRGVDWHKQRGKWRVRLKSHGIRKDLGFYSDIKDAVIARKAAEGKYVGEFIFSNK